MGRKANTLRIVRMIGGKRQELEIPVERARQLGIGTEGSAPATIAYLMDGVLAWQEAGQASTDACPRCGTTHRELVLRHTVGCAECFETFSSTIGRLLRLAGKETAHAGRIPRRLIRYRRLFVEREELLHRLNLAVEREDFEAAARIRDRIRTITEADTWESGETEADRRIEHDD